jgi:hypothetical protein
MIKQSHRHTSPDDIQSLAANECFVFGSNEAGRHGSGAAKTALKWGAIYGQGHGHFGQTYALPTKDYDVRTLDLEDIAIYVSHLIEYAISRPDLIFLVSAVGCGLAGYRPSDIAPLFFAHELPANVWLPQSFWVVYEAADPQKLIQVDNPLDKGSPVG